MKVAVGEIKQSEFAVARPTDSGNKFGLRNRQIRKYFEQYKAGLDH
jgi:hypothetical protein